MRAKAPTTTRALFAALLLAAGACAFACSSRSSDASREPSTATLPDSGTCTAACCELPVPNTSCAVDAGTTCAYAVTCPEGLVLSRSTTCEAGVWKAVNDCPAAGAVDGRGCPSAQPQKGAPCTLTQPGATCGYTKTCDAKACDGGDCVPVRTSAQATCSQGVWVTTPLDPC